MPDAERAEKAKAHRQAQEWLYHKDASRRKRTGLKTRHYEENKGVLGDARWQGTADTYAELPHPIGG